MMLRVLAILLFFMASALDAGEPFAPGKERDWEFLNQGKFRGTFEKLENGKAFIRMSDGVVREFWPGVGDGIAGSFFQRLMCKLPANPAKREPAPGSGPVVDISADALPDGPLAAWKNAGRLGGSFLAMNQPPHVAQVAGRKAVVFAHAPWLLPMEFETMVSDFYMPESVIGARSITVVAWLHNTGAAVDRETFLCWGEKDCGELDGPDFSYGCYDAMQWYDEKMSIPQPRFPKLGQWHQFAFVLTPSEKDKNRCDLALYVGGEFVVRRSVKNPPAKLLGNNLAFLGCAWEAWWGHKWETRPARPYTGAISAVKIFDRALSLAEIRQLDGRAPTAVPTTPAQSAAISPMPATGARDVPTVIEHLAWKPNPDATAQVLHFGTEKSAVIAGSAAKVKLKAQVEEAFLSVELKLPKLEAGKTYHWRVEQILPDKSLIAGEPWSFTTSDFDLEYDGPVSGPFPKEIVQDGFYERSMEGFGGYPIISPPGNEDVHLRAARHALQKLHGKRPDLVKALQASHAATHLASQENRGWGWSQFVCSSYGEGNAILREMGILLHESGHQFHMQGAEQVEPDFRHRLGEIFNTARHERRWMGDYGGANMWEHVAVCASWWVNDMTQDEGAIRPREVLRQNDPRAHELFSAWWPGDLLIDLHPSGGLTTDAGGGVTAWANRGGIEYFRPDFGWRFYKQTTGRFTPGSGRPALRTVGGVSAVAFAGADTLAWDKSTWDALDGNRAWSADLWVFREKAAAGDETLIEWGTAAAPGAKLTWGASDQACVFPGGIGAKWTHKPEPGRWHHLAWVFTGGGASDGPGELRIYVDGTLDSTAHLKLALPPNAGVTAGRGFAGGIAHLRLHDYDLHPLQVAAIWKKESPAYLGETSNVAGRLLVNLDANILGPVNDDDVWPLYPASLGKPWLRSWVNLGTLAGRLHNDARTPGASQPRAGIARGVQAVSFDGRSRIISSFAAAAPMSGTVEMWIFPEPGAPAGNVFQWGAWSLPAKVLRPGTWQHVSMVFEKGVPAIFINGVRLSGAQAARGAGSSERLIVGEGFRGHLAQFRIHEGILQPAQLTANIRQSAILRPRLPEPSQDAEVVGARQPALNWQPGLSEKTARCDVYLATDAATIAAADRKSAAYQGAKTPGEFRPRLQPGTRYHWRVDLLDAKGQPQLRGPVWSFVCGQGLVLDLDAADLAAGPLKSWTSKGAARAVFTPGTERENWKPAVANIAGRNGVDFSGRKSLVSSQPAPASLLGGGPFTVSIWSHYADTRGLEREQTMLSWGRRPAERAEFCWGSHVARGAFVGGPKIEFGFKGSHTENDSFRHNAPLPDGWRHIAWTHDAAAKTLRIFVDGKLNREETVTLAIKPGELLCLGGARTGRLPDASFHGLLSEVAIADTVATDADIARLAQGTPASAVRLNWLVRLDARELAPGPLAGWPNLGSLGGEFAPEAETAAAPRSEIVNGRPAVTFDGQKNFLRSDISTPTSLTGDHPFTVEAWILNPKLADVETFLSLAPSVAMKAYPHDAVGRAANFNFGAARETGRELRAGFFSSGPTSRHVGWTDAAVPATDWQHIAFVYTGGYRGAFRVYRDGQLLKERGFFTLDTLGGQPMHIGAAWNTALGAMNGFSGSLARLQVSDYARTEEEIRADAKPAAPTGTKR